RQFGEYRAFASDGVDDAFVPGLTLFQNRLSPSRFFEERLRALRDLRERQRTDVLPIHPPKLRHVEDGGRLLEAFHREIGNHFFHRENLGVARNRLHFHSRIPSEEREEVQ